MLLAWSMNEEERQFGEQKDTGLLMHIRHIQPFSSMSSESSSSRAARPWVQISSLSWMCVTGGICLFCRPHWVMDARRAACFLSHLWPSEGQTSSTFSTSSKLCKSFGGWDLWGLDCSWCIVGYVHFCVQLQNESRKQHCFTLKRSRCLLSALSSPANIRRKSFMDQQATRMSNTSQLPLSLHYFFSILVL